MCREPGEYILKREDPAEIGRVGLSVKELHHLKEDEAEWCSAVTTLVENLESDHEITITRGLSVRSSTVVQSLPEFRTKVALPYIDANVHNRFSDEAVKLPVSSSVFNPASLPPEEASLPAYGKKEVDVLAQFYGTEAKVVFDGNTFSSPPLVDKDEVVAEWRLFKRALKQESKVLMEKDKTTKAPNLQDVKAHNYGGIWSLYRNLSRDV